MNFQLVKVLGLGGLAISIKLVMNFIVQKIDDYFQFFFEVPVFANLNRQSRNHQKLVGVFFVAKMKLPRKVHYIWYNHIDLINEFALVLVSWKIQISMPLFRMVI